MDATKNTLALILRRSPYRESDLLITAYMRNLGKQVMVARGAKKAGSKLAGHLEPLTLAEIMIIYGRGRNYAGGASAVNAYPGLRGDLNKLYFSGKAIGWFDRLVKDDEPDERLFLLITKWLEVLSRLGGKKEMSRESGELLFAFLALKVMMMSGYQPEMYKCLNCRRPVAPGKNYFNPQNGGLICAECYDKIGLDKHNLPSGLLTISNNCVKIIRFIMEKDLKQTVKLKTDKKIIKELSSIVGKFLEYHS